MRRRDFLKTTAVTASGLIVPLVHVASQTDARQEETEIQVALIGVGYQGRIAIRN